MIASTHHENLVQEGINTHAAMPQITISMMMSAFLRTLDGARVTEVYKG